MDRIAKMAAQPLARVGWWLGLGNVLVAVVLFLFLGEVRSAIVVIVTLPLGLPAASAADQAVSSLRKQTRSPHRAGRPP